MAELQAQKNQHLAGYCFTDVQFSKVAERTGLEPATPGVTGRYSNRLNYRSALE